MVEFFSGHKETRRPTGERGSGLSQVEPLRWSSRMHGISAPSNPKAIRYSSRNDVDTYYQLPAVFDVAKLTTAQELKAKIPVRKYWTKNNSSPGGYYQLNGFGDDFTTYTDYLSKLYQRVMAARDLLLKNEKMGIADSGAYSKFNDVVNSYNNLVDLTVKKFVEKKIAYPGFYKIKTTNMQDWRQYGTWYKQFSWQKGGLFGDLNWKTLGAEVIGGAVVFFATGGILLPPYIIAVVGYDISQAFSRASNRVQDLGKKLLDDEQKDIQDRLDRGEITDIEALEELSAKQDEIDSILKKHGHQTLTEAEKEKNKKKKEEGGILDKIFGKANPFIGLSKGIQTGVTIAIVGTTIVGGALIYTAIKRRKEIVKLTAAVATKNPALLFSHI